MDNVTESPGEAQPVTGYRLAHGYVSGIICLTGFILNIFNIIVWSRKSMRTSTNVLLAFLAVADAISLFLYGVYAVYFFIATGPSELIYHSEAGMYSVIICFHEFIAFHTFANWLTISLAIFRYMKVCHSDAAKKYCSTKRAKMTVVIVFVATALATVPFYPYYGVYESSVNGNNITGYWIQKTTFANTHVDYQTVLLWVYGVIFKLVPSIAMVVLSSLIVRELRAARKRQDNLSSEQAVKGANARRGYTRTTIMLITIVMIYVVMEIPIGIMAFLSGLEGGESHFFYFLLYSSVGDILDLTALVNGLVNFFVYFGLCHQFRMVFNSEILAKVCKRYNPTDETLGVRSSNLELSSIERSSIARAWKAFKETLSSNKHT